MINYIEKGIGLHRAIAAAGEWAEQRDGEWVCSDPIAVQAIIDSYPLASYRAELLAPIKQHAQELIYARYPQWRQANMTARALELSFIQVLAPQEALELDGIRAAWAWIQAVRAHCATFEAGLDACATAGDITLWQQSTDWRTGWPTI